MSNNIHTMCCIGNVNQVIGICIEIFPENLARIFQKFIEFTTKKEHRLAFQTQLPVLIGFKNRLWSCAKGTVIQKGNGWIEQEVFT